MAEIVVANEKPKIQERPFPEDGTDARKRRVRVLE